ncbi:MAG TPA: hypothetical protein VGR07_05600 [Thermoanaerobaculia bacterium]|jgi:hypothetical protein|nr:hypothetical protein [Thermoanaerobaculia bacterium]
MMELPAEVLIHNETLGVKGGKGTLLQVSDGYYEINCVFGERLHRTLFPIQGTVLISREPEQTVGGEAMEIER